MRKDINKSKIPSLDYRRKCNTNQI